MTNGLALGRRQGTAWIAGVLMCVLWGTACQSTPRKQTPAPSSRAGVTAEEWEPEEWHVEPLGESDVGHVLVCAKVLAVDPDDRIFSPGMIVVRNGLIEAVGPVVEDAALVGYERLEFPEGWAAPGLVDLHSHVQTGTWGDINDSVRSINCEFRTSPTIVPGNKNVERACAGGVTTMFGIPGSGSNMSGFGVLYKAKWGNSYDAAVLADPGGLKVAQDSNPQRPAPQLGASRAAMGWMLEDANDRAIAALEQDRFDPALENLKRVHTKELPVLIHTAGSDGVLNTARMWRGTYDTNSVISHGSFDGWRAAAYVAEMDMPVNNGPRTMDYYSTRDGRIVGMADEYHDAGVPLISMNTDAGVMPQEELFLQASMGSRLGADNYLMLRAVTAHPAITFGIDDRVGSLEVGKDADVVIWNGEPLDPRARVEAVMIDGRIEYDRARDGQRF